MSQSVCILYGISEGPLVGKRLVSVFEEAGFKFVHDPATADIIFAHSGGCFLVPTTCKARIVLLVGIPWWPKKPWVICTAAKIVRELRQCRGQGKLLQWLRKCAAQARYTLSIRNALRMAVNRATDRSWNSRGEQIVIRNRYDTYCSPGILSVLFKGPRTFISLPGGHDDCWGNPAPYAELLQSLTEHS